MGRRSPRRNAARAVAAKKTRAVRPRYRLAPPCNERGPTVCAPHNPAHFVLCAACEAGLELGAG